MGLTRHASAVCPRTGRPPLSEPSLAVLLTNNTAGSRPSPRHISIIPTVTALCQRRRCPDGASSVWELTERRPAAPEEGRSMWRSSGNGLGRAGGGPLEVGEVNDAAAGGGVLQGVGPILRGAVLQEVADGGSGIAALPDGPHDEGLTAPAVSSSKHALHVGLVVAVLRQEIGAGIGVDAKPLGQGLLRAQEAHGEQAQVGLDDVLSAGLLHQLSGLHDNLHNFQALQVAVAVPDEALGQDVVLPGVLAICVGGLSVAIVHTEDAGPCGPGVAGGAVGRGLVEQLQVDHVGGAVAH
mmetsp:Transcript_2416/g.6985  ORF Transcript_2416/g.6985 Transcript_2416/m.6985 type:complete len:296 (-) Transcript_2416:405-1292(-)